MCEVRSKRRARLPTDFPLRTSTFDLTVGWRARHDSNLRPMDSKPARALATTCLSYHLQPLPRGRAPNAFLIAPAAEQPGSLSETASPSHANRSCGRPHEQPRGRTCCPWVRCIARSIRNSIATCMTRSVTRHKANRILFFGQPRPCPPPAFAAREYWKRPISPIDFHWIYISLRLKSLARWHKRRRRASNCPDDMAISSPAAGAGLPTLLSVPDSSNADEKRNHQ